MPRKRQPGLRSVHVEPGLASPAGVEKPAVALLCWADGTQTRVPLDDIRTDEEMLRYLEDLVGNEAAQLFRQNIAKRRIMKAIRAGIARAAKSLDEAKQKTKG